MKFAYSWLKELVDIELAPKQLAEFLSSHALEAELAEKEQVFENIIVAKVVKVEKHPNADRLRVVELSDGTNAFAPVVCGAWNFEAGAIVALALPGALIPHDQHDPEGKPFTLSKAKIRGIESQGMICSAKELGLPARHASQGEAGGGEDGGGIMLLDESYQLGQNLAVKDKSAETLLDLSIPANRPDLLAYRGIAWEIAALSGKKYKASKISSKISKLKAKVLKVRISEPKLCERYIAVRLSDIQVEPSPKFIQDRLKSSGMRPINNVVDITNYVMLETGQPLHAFDALKVAGAINVRRAYVNEAIKTLDNVERKLSADALVIADAKKALAVAGVIGGVESAVNLDTREIILEAACFNSVSIRRTSKRLGIRTDASSRFEKSLPADFTNLGAEYAVELLQKYAQGKALEYIQAGSSKTKAVVIKYNPLQTNDLLGVNFAPVKQIQILKKLGFLVHITHSTYHVTVPFWRPDVKIWQDLAEEVERFNGLDNIKSEAIALVHSSTVIDKVPWARNKIEDLCAGLGFNQIYTYSFVSEQDLSAWGMDKTSAVEVANPLSQDQQFLRPDLIINSIKIAEQNLRYEDEGDHFEIGSVYWKSGSEFKEQIDLLMVSYSRKSVPVSRLTGSVRELAKSSGIAVEIIQQDEQLANILHQGKIIGCVFAKDTPEIKWVAANIDFSEIVKLCKIKEYEGIVKYPSKELDLAVLAREDLAWSEIKHKILSISKLIVSVNLFDVYQGKNIPIGKRSLAFRIVLQSREKTLTDAEIGDIQKQIIKALEVSFHIQLRD